jgi:hypothetical protein
VSGVPISLNIVVHVHVYIYIYSLCNFVGKSMTKVGLLCTWVNKSLLQRDWRTDFKRNSVCVCCAGCLETFELQILCNYVAIMWELLGEYIWCCAGGERKPAKVNAGV